MHICIVTKTKLPFLISTPCNELTSILQQNKCSIFSSDNLTALYCAWLVKYVNWEIVLYFWNFTWIFNNNFIIKHWVLCALAIIIPSPTVSFSSPVASNRMGGSNLQFKNWIVIFYSVFVQLHPLTCPRSAMLLRKITNNVKICNSIQQRYLLVAVWCMILDQGRVTIVPKKLK